MMVRTVGGIGDLSRAVGVFALYDLTPDRLVVERQSMGGLSLDFRLCADAQTLVRAASRMQALTCVLEVETADDVMRSRGQA